MLLIDRLQPETTLPSSFMFMRYSVTVAVIFFDENSTHNYPFEPLLHSEGEYYSCKMTNLTPYNYFDALKSSGL